MNLHCSQTRLSVEGAKLWFYTSMNLHCSQTTSEAVRAIVAVLYLYEFTLLSNSRSIQNTSSEVLYLYEFTLLSNDAYYMHHKTYVLYLYEFTLLSNGRRKISLILRFYTSMNLHCSQTPYLSGITDIMFYTSMNLHCSQTVRLYSMCLDSFIPL